MRYGRTANRKNRHDGKTTIAKEALKAVRENAHAFKHVSNRLEETGEILMSYYSGDQLVV